MSLGFCLWGMRISVLFLAAAWGLVVFFVDPEKSGRLGLALFYTTLFLLLAGMFTLFFMWLARKFRGWDAAAQVVGMNFRQGILLALLAFALLFLQSQRMLVWWDGLLVTAGILLVELYFLTRKE